MNTSEAFLVALLLVFAVPYIVWRLSDVQDYAPLVVVQVIAGLILGPSVLGAAFPAYYKLVFTPAVITSLSAPDRVSTIWAFASTVTDCVELPILRVTGSVEF